MTGESKPPEPDLQFDRAEYVSASAAATACARCRSPIDTAYYTLGQDVLCSGCATQTIQQLEGGSRAGRAVRAIVLGGLAGLLGAGIYYAVAAITGYEIGLVAIAVGFLVGFAVRMGSRGRGGRFYQLLAVFLTYSAIGMSYFATVVQGLSRSGELSAASAAADDGSVPPNPAVAMVFLLGFVLALPVLVSIQSPLGFVIIGIALFEAWRLNRGHAMAVAGPFSVRTGAGSAIDVTPPTLPPLPGDRA